MQYSPTTVVWAARPRPLYFWLRVALPVLSIVIACDQLSKWLLSQIFPKAQVRPAGGDYVIMLHFRPGSFRSPANLIRLGILILCVAVSLYFLKRLWHMPKGYFALGLLGGGSLSNVFDYLRGGRAFEWVSVRGWPASNLADVAVGIGGFLFFWVLLQRIRWKGSRDE